MPESVHCPTCHHSLTQIGKFWICPEHGQVSLPDFQGQESPVHPPSLCLHPLRIFLSYGHDSNEELVRHIKADLEKRGHDVWFDKDPEKGKGITPGDDWRRAITDGITGSNRVLSFLSKHSTRDPGVCLDEIAIAIGVKGGNIQTILVESETEVKPPASISHIQWLDMHDWKERRGGDETAWENWYQEKLAEIIAVVESDESRRFAGEIKSLEELLKPTVSDFACDARIRQLLEKKLVGRTWLFDAVENWRSTAVRDARLFWLMGAPGIGKSSFAAHLAHEYGRGTVIAIQFCDWKKPDHRDACRIIRTLAFQIATRLPDYRKLLLTLPILTELDQKNSAELFGGLLTNPLKMSITGRRERYLIVIDALDEAGGDGRNELVEVLARYAWQLPDWIGLVVTSRPEFDVTTPFHELKPFPFETKSAANSDDICAYLWRELATQLQNRPDADRLVEQILEKSEGVFLYVESFCEDIRTNHLSLDWPNDFPQGLAGKFCIDFQRYFPALEKFRKDVRPALRAILAAREPLPLEILQRLFNWQDEELHDFTRPLASLFSVTGEAGHEVIKPYHKSLADWLTDEAKAGAYFVSVNEGHRDLAAFGWKEFNARLLDEDLRGDFATYICRTLPMHLYLSSCFSNLRALLVSARAPYIERWVTGAEHGDGLMCMSGLIDHYKDIDAPLAGALETQRARIYVRMGAYDDAETSLNFAVDNTSFWSHSRTKAVAYHELASLKLYSGDLKSARKLYNLALFICRLQRSNVFDEIAANTIGLATVDILQCDYKKTISRAKKAEHYAKRANDYPHIIGSKRLIANAHKDLLMLNESESTLQSALAIADARIIGVEMIAVRHALAWLEYYRSVVCGYQTTLAADRFHDTLRMLQKFAHSVYFRECHIGLISCALAHGDVDLANKILLTLERINVEPIPSSVRCHYEVVRAGCSHSAGHFDSAKTLYEKALALARQHGDTHREIQAQVGLGSMEFRLGNERNAVMIWAEAATKARNCGPLRIRLCNIGIESSKINPKATPP